MFKSRRARLVAAALMYVGLWVGTQVVGAPRVRAAVAAKHLPPPEQIKTADQYAHCEAVALAPFLVKARYGWHLAALLGGAGTEYYAWVGPTALSLWTGSTLAE